MEEDAELEAVVEADAEAKADTSGEAEAEVDLRKLSFELDIPT